MSRDPFDSRAPVTILTGWLGAGKTTLLNHLLTDPHGQRFAVLVNEFGEIGVDQRLIRRSNEDIVELSNGCVCCSVRGDLVRTLKRLRKRRAWGLLPAQSFDHVLLETTGIAEPAPLLRTFLVEEGVAALYRVDSVVALVDSAHWNRAAAETAARDQIALADFLVLNKKDLVDSKEMALVEKEIVQLNPISPLLKTTQAELDSKMVLQAREPRPLSELEGYPMGHHHSENEIHTITLTTSKPLDILKAELWFNSIASSHSGELVRWKGFLNLEGCEERAILQGTYELFNVASEKPWGTLPRRTELVFIGRNLKKESLERGLQACVAGNPTIT
ncbi:MAG: GTP-binding protein [Planctomycetota bacterium]|jgi:G3E family GTPase|nr:GTP-binding protein [Planctomycetota bacterium]